ncbi:MAG: BON domain-containing protein [Planctomycetes bacterium]|nr:BON domain-containing protein [Planctomycetota bacterium]
MRTAIFALALGAAACSSARRSEDPVARDREVVRDIMWAFRRDARFRRIEVACKDGVVTLAGPVTSEEDREEAEAIAWGVASVREVRSELRLRAR